MAGPAAPAGAHTARPGRRDRAEASCPRRRPPDRGRPHARPRRRPPGAHRCERLRPPLEPMADGFRNRTGEDGTPPAEYRLVDQPDLLDLTPQETTVLAGGLRAPGATYRNSALGALTRTPGRLTNDYFVNLLDPEVRWARAAHDETVCEGRDTTAGTPRWTGGRTDLVFGSHPELRALAEVYAGEDGQAKFTEDFAAAWTKVMDLERFDPTRARTRRLADGPSTEMRPAARDPRYRADEAPVPGADTSSHCRTRVRVSACDASPSGHYGFRGETPPGGSASSRGAHTQECT
nr:peroxidase family protein [Streptomyces sp. S1]